MKLRNAQRLSLKALPQEDFASFRQAILGERTRPSALFALPDGNDFQLIAVLAGEALEIHRTVVGAAYPSLTPDRPALSLFERELKETWQIHPEGHPWLQPVRTPQEHFYRVDGAEIHEVAVGPVHAGIIEPGHFRFQCHGETVFHLEIALGYQHRGIEKALRGGPNSRTLPLMEGVAGDTTIGHALAYAQVIEALSGARVSEKAEAIRALALELERIANHVGDLGALAGDVGFLPTASYCGRLRGDFLNLTAVLCGNRFGRGLILPGGTGFDLDPERVQALRQGLKRALPNLEEAVELLFRTPSVLARFHEAGKLDAAMARELGLVGVAARACGLDRDVRREFPTGFYRSHPIPLARWESGNVYARARLRWLEIRYSLEFIQAALDTLERLEKSDAPSVMSSLAADSLAVALVEGWRGEICHVAVTDEQGAFLAYKIVDPSFHNWPGLAMAMRNQEISDFPLCNKSFNLSYCGHDL